MNLVDRLFRNPKTGELVVAQPPNLPLIVFLVAAVVRAVLEIRGTPNRAVDLVATAAIVVWAVLEVGWGDSLFRRLLGAVVLVGVLAGRVLL